MTGTVLWCNRRYGFIKDSFGEEFYFPKRDFSCEIYHGQAVEFELSVDKKTGRNIVSSIIPISKKTEDGKLILTLCFLKIDGIRLTSDQLTLLSSKTRYGLKNLYIKNSTAIYTDYEISDLNELLSFLEKIDEIKANAVVHSDYQYDFIFV